MGFAARKSKLAEVALTTEIGQDGMLFITNRLFKKLLINYSDSQHILNYPIRSELRPLSRFNNRRIMGRFPIILSNEHQITIKIINFNFLQFHLN